MGSQVFGEDVYERTADIMLAFLKECRDDFGAALPELDMGGGYGVRYVDSDDHVDIPAAIGRVAAHMKEVCRKLGMDMPYVHMEPGRSIVADAGLTLYTVGTVKKITGYKNYVSIDGGMTDNPRYALYGSKYTVLLASAPWTRRTFCATWWGGAAKAATSSSQTSISPSPSAGRWWRCAPPARTTTPWPPTITACPARRW